MNVDTEIGTTVAVDVALDEHVTDRPHKMQFARPVVKALCTNEVKGLVTHLPDVGVDV